MQVCRVSVSEVIIFMLYLASAGTLGVSYLLRYSTIAGTLFLAAYTLAANTGYRL